jgi:uncharacterized protein
MNKTVSIIITLGLVIAIGVIFMGGAKKSNTNVGSTQGVEIKDGVQYVTVDAKGGYSPRVTEARAGIPTKLIMKTNGTYDCSASLVIRSVGFQKILPQTGETEIDLGIPKAGEPLRGICGMGMYSFIINFS